MSGDLLPIRFAGSRCIDYGVANAVRLEGQCQSAPSVISDRKVFQVNVRLPKGIQAGQVHALANSMDLSRQSGSRALGS